LWSEIAELASLAGTHLHIHIANDILAGPDANLRRLQIWANLASFGTFTATVNAAHPGGGGSAIWEDLRPREEFLLTKENRSLERHNRMAIYSPFSANCLLRAGDGEQLISATERMNRITQHRSIQKNPHMAHWYAIGAKRIGPPNGF
jgi:hypothetical protein